MSNVKEKLDQIRAIAAEVAEEDPSAAIIIAIDSQGKQAGSVYGKGVNLAAILAYTINKTDGLLEVVEAAVDAYKNVPLK